MPGSYEVRELTPAEGADAATWRYPGELSAYDGHGEPLTAADGYWAVEDGQGAFVGFCCFGAEARVPGLDAEPDVLDIGAGMRPDLVAGGRGRRFLEAIVEFGLDTYEPERLRAVVLDWNARSLAVCQRLGFEPAGEVTTERGRFVVVERPA